MEEGYNPKVFESEVPVIRFTKPELYELIETPVAQPAMQHHSRPDNIPNLNNASVKSYVSRRTCKQKVRTVRQIRKEYEDYILEYLPSDLEMQHRYLLDKICRGSSRDDRLVETAKKLMKSKSPMRRSTWQMLMTINPECVSNPKQYVIFNKLHVKLSGSTGGAVEILYNLNLTNKSKVIKLKSPKKNGLLQTSLEVTFKPGPLTRKKSLDTSYQKFTLGITELMPLPKVGLEIITTRGVPLQPSLYGYLQNSREIDGILTKDWINFAVSPLDSHNSDNVITFPVKYKNNQKRILMRDSSAHLKPLIPGNFTKTVFTDKEEEEIKLILKDLLTAVEINVIQNTLLLDDDLNMDTDQQDDKIPSPQKGKSQRNNNAELKKLDVTILHIDGNSTVEDPIICTKSYCRLGCVCRSLQCKIRLKSHCGQIDCMFDCKCNYNMYFVNEESFKGCISGLVNLDRKNDFKLAKEEQKFRQTVVFTEGKGILLSSKRRNPRKTQKYADYLNSRVEKHLDQNKELVISVPKLNFSNIEPWCMVHELYRCFCRGKFLASSDMSCTDNENNFTICETQISDHITSNNERLGLDNEANKITPSLCKTNEISVEEIIDVVSEDSLPNTHLKRSHPENDEDHAFTKHIKLDNPQSSEYYTSSTCARARPYMKRKSETNRETSKTINNNENPSYSAKQPLKPATFIKNKENPSNSAKHPLKPATFGIWLERHYKHLKDRMNAGQPIILEKPVPKRMSLFPWPALLRRFQLKNNYFLVNKSPPHRVFISVNPKFEEFSNCMDLNDVKLEDLPNYPDFVHHFFVRADLKDNFVLLKGSKNYWEVLGLVAKNNVRSRTPLPVTNNGINCPVSCISEINETSFVPRKYDCPEQSKNVEINSSTLPVKDISIDSSGGLIQHNTMPSNYGKRQISIELKKSRKRKKRFSSALSVLNVSEEGKSLIYNNPVKKQNHSSNNKSEHKDIDDAMRNNVPNQSTDDSDDETVINETINMNTEHENSRTSDSDEVPIENDHTTQEVTDETSHNSRWFVMTVENDFMRLLFYKKRQYVKYQTIMEAIELARTSDRTVSLPISNSKVSKVQGTPFGIYATPEMDKACIFIGPYNRNEDLGIETIRGPNHSVSIRKTRGVWLLTKKVDNYNVLHKPLSYLPRSSDNKIYTKKNKQNNVEIITQSFAQEIIKPTILNKINDRDLKHAMHDKASSEPENNIDRMIQSSAATHEEVTVHKDIVPKDPVKTARIVKPIRIRRDNSFYQLGANGLFKPISLLKPLSSDTKNILPIPNSYKPIRPEPTLCIPVISGVGSLAPDFNASPVKLKSLLKTTLDTDSDKNLIDSKKTIFTVLKPEQINRKVINTQAAWTDKEIHKESVHSDHTGYSSSDSSKVYILSDEDSSLSTNDIDETDILIECISVSNLGCIRGRRNAANEICFQFPGFKFTPYSTEAEAFAKINQVLSRKVYVPKFLSLNWRVADFSATRRLMTADNFGPDFVVTKAGLVRKDLLAIRSRNRASSVTVSITEDDSAELGEN